MKHEHGYAFGALIAAIAAGVIVAAYAQHKYGELSPIVLVIAIGPSIFTSLYCICRVSVDDREIRIGYFAPFRRTKVYPHEEIEFYAPVRGLNAGAKPILGIMKATKEKKGFILWGQELRISRPFPISSNHSTGTQKKHNQPLQTTATSRRL